MHKTLMDGEIKIALVPAAQLLMQNQLYKRNTLSCPLCTVAYRNESESSKPQ